MELNRAIQSRKSVRKFKDKKPDWRNIIECIDAARYAPMAGNNFTLKFIFVDDKEKINKLADAAQQSFISQVKYVVVVCSNPSRTENAYDNRGEIYCRQQAGAAIENFLLKIEEMGLSTCWVGAFVDRMVKEILKIPENIKSETMNRTRLPNILIFIVASLGFFLWFFMAVVVVLVGNLIDKILRRNNAI